jgi:hypothetical protein
MAMMGMGPWAPAQETFNRFARMDSQLGRKLADLSAQQARDDKLAFAIEAGRVYGLRTQKLNMNLKKELYKDWKYSPTEPMWNASEASRFPEKRLAAYLASK